MTRSKEVEKLYKKNYERDHKMVKGKFSFLEVPGGTLRFSYIKYDGDKTLRYELKDGEVYELPYMVAKHLATDVSYPVHSFQTDELGKPVMAIGRTVHRTGFQRLDFLEDDDFVPSKIITAEAIV